MYNLFSPSAGDESILYLYNIFGSAYGAIPTPSGQTAANITLLSTMFKTFNGVVLSVGALVILYVTVIGVMQTAAEGEFMGKKWNNIWIPIRSVLGVAALVPMGSGYSALQILLMWFIVQGVGAADMLWNTALGYVQTVGSPNAKVVVPSAATKSVLTEFFKGLTCYESGTFTAAAPYTNAGLPYYCTSDQGHSNDGLCKSPMFAPSYTDLQGTQDNPRVTYSPANMNSTGTTACGVLTYCSYYNSCTTDTMNSLACLSCQAQLQALADIIPVLSSIGAKLAQADYDYQNYYYTSASQMATATSGGNTQLNTPSWIQKYCNDKGISNCYGGDNGGLPTPNDPNGNGESAPSDVVDNVYWPYAIEPVIGAGDFVQIATDHYTDALNGAVTTYINQQGQSNLSGMYADASNYGWIRAGAYYYNIVKQNSANLSQSMPPLAFSYDNNIVPTDSNNVMYHYRNNYDAATELQKQAACTAPGVDQSSCASSSPQSDAVNNSTSDINNMITTQLNSGAAPIVIVAQIGAALLAEAVHLYLVVMGISIIAAALSSINVIVVGSGATVNPASAAVTMAAAFVLPALLAFVGILISYGALLGVYIPLIPFILFTFGAIGWLISIIEAMVAAPIVALGILSPSGEHELLGKAAPSMFLILSIFLRPSLMVFGMMASMLLANAAVAMVNAPFVYATKDSLTAFDIPVVGQVIFIGLWVALIIIVMNKSFALIYLIPERVMMWIGQHAGHGGAEGLEEAKGGVTGAAAGAAGGARATGSAPKQLYGAREEGAKFKKIQANANQANAQVDKKKDEGG